MPDILRLCMNCKHKRDDPDGDAWEWCDRPNYPPGNWNMLTSVQRYTMTPENMNLCAGRHWEPIEKHNVEVSRDAD